MKKKHTVEEEGKVLKEKLVVKFKRLFPDDEIPADIGLREIEAMQARIRELEMKIASQEKANPAVISSTERAVSASIEPQSYKMPPEASVQKDLPRQIPAFPPILGVGLVIAVGLLSYWVSGFDPSLEALAVALILGMALRSFLVNRVNIEAGVQLAMKIFIPLGIILYGVRLDIPRLGNLALPIILRIALNILLFYLVVFILDRGWPMRRATTTLLASGSAICGASAIVVLSPVADAEPEDTSASLLVVTVIGLLGAMLFPVLKAIFGWNDQFFALLAGSTLHQTATVKLAVEGLRYEIIEYALTVKMVRIVMLIPVAIGLAWLRHRKGGGWLKALGQIWFVFVFALVGALVSFTHLRAYGALLAPWSTLALTLAMSSIGLSVDYNAVVNAGMRPLVIGLIAWLIVFTFFALSLTVFPIL
ncbi:MAG: hypothetical protein Fur0043_02590 [Anaerolineales bacterium]